MIRVPRLDTALREYARLLVPAATAALRPDADRALFRLANTALELRQAAVEKPEIAGVVLRDAGAGPEPRAVANALNLRVERCDGSRGDAAPLADDRLAVDHLVLRTDDADACIDFFQGDMGIRLALDKTVPEWGGRMLFFRAGKMTLEVVQSGAHEEEPGGSYFWGIAYRHPSLDTLREELCSRGVRCSAVREGRKPGTRVATVKSDCLGIPTLLIQPAP